MTAFVANPQEYLTGLEAFRRAVRELEPSLNASDLRIEVQFESLRDWSRVHTLDEVRGWFRERRRTCTMRVADIALAECQGWYMDESSGWLRHESGEFFYVQGVRVSQTADREVGERGWDQPMVTQVGRDGGILGLLRKRIDGIPHYLVEAKSEPGNYQRVQMSPTLQATFSNLKRAHEGRRPRYAQYFEDPEAHEAKVLYRQWLSEDGGRLHKKRNLGMLVELPERVEIRPHLTFIWMSMWQIKACLLEDAWVNPHIRGIIAHL